MVRARENELVVIAGLVGSTQRKKKITYKSYHQNLKGLK